MCLRLGGASEANVTIRAVVFVGRLGGGAVKAVAAALRVGHQPTT